MDAMSMSSVKGSRKKQKSVSGGQKICNWERDVTMMSQVRIWKTFSQPIVACTRCEDRRMQGVFRMHRLSERWSVQGRNERSNPSQRNQTLSRGCPRSVHHCSHFESTVLTATWRTSSFTSLPKCLSSQTSPERNSKTSCQLTLLYISLFCLFFFIALSVLDIAFYIYLFLFVDYLSPKLYYTFHKDRGISEFSLLYLSPIPSLKPLKSMSK